jgi:SOS-response transcriptional repressor LexA
MTPRQLLVLEAIEDYWAEQHCGPSLEAIAKKVGVSSRSTIHSIVKRLHEDGWITMQPKRWRTMMSTRNSPLKAEPEKVEVVEKKVEPEKPKVIHRTVAPEHKPVAEMTTEERKKEWLARMKESSDEINKILKNT